MLEETLIAAAPYLASKGEIIMIDKLSSKQRTWVPYAGLVTP